jgi:hypothetical protein
MKTDRQALEDAIELIADEDHWTKRSFARDRYGNPIMDALDERAEVWCAMGALRKAVGARNLEYSRQMNRLEAAVVGHDVIERTRGLAALVLFNDHLLTTHEEVILAMKRGLDRLPE